MKRSTLTALLASTIVGGSLFAYSVVSHAEDKKEPVVAAAAKTPAKDYAVVKYKGGEITRAELDKQWAAMFPGADVPNFDSFDDGVKVEILKNVARERLVLDKAYAKKVDSSDEVKKQLENVKRQIIIGVYLKSIVNELVPEKDIRKEYDVMVEKFKGKKEVKARHILVATEAEANDIYKQLEKGADFAKLAQEKSTDKGSGAKGGDLGYFTKERMVPEFAEAAFGAEKGKFTKPVKTDFGYHIILVEDVRDLKAPSYEEVKDKIRDQLANANIERYVNNLFKDSNVKFYGADGKELKESAKPAAAGGMSPVPAE